ncbi:MAG: Rieske 2Fe-2S domain-containing protein [Chitinophagales bacterium]|nr:Rieske 2Fe-2S domain-containing protein [Chitinophagales bacterium]
MNKSSRRDFIKQAGTISVCACAFGTASLFSSCSVAKGITGTESAEMVTIPKTSFKDSNSVSITTKKYSEPIYIAKQADETYIALLMYCPHKGCEVRAGTEKLVCPCHNSEFSLTGSLLRGPAKEGLKSFVVNEEKDLIAVHFN